MKSSEGVFPHLVDAVLPGGGLVVSLCEVYIDESGTHDGSPIMTMGGYIFRSEQARRFSREWSKDLDRMGLPYAHMKDCNRGTGPYAYMSKEQCVDAEKKLISHIKRRTIYGFASSLDPQRYEEIVRSEPGMPTAYSFSVMSCVDMVRRWIERERYQGQVAYFFESGHRHQVEANLYMNDVANDDRKRSLYRYAAHAFVGKLDAPPLQAADMLAWQYQHYLRRRGEGFDTPRADFTALLRPHCDWCRDYTDKTLVDFRRLYRENLNANGECAEIHLS